LIYPILDEAIYGSVGYVIDGQPFVIPMVYGRIESTLYFHGSKGARIHRTLRKGQDVCLSAMILDAIVLSRTAIGLTVNYRSVVALGRTHEVTDTEEKLVALEALVEQVSTGTWDYVRKPNERELGLVQVLAMPIREASAKIRAGAPIDEEEDLDLPQWAGEIPVGLRFGPPVSDPTLRSNVEPPHHAVFYQRHGGR
jgi:nitroimidazol reductase NimA-like FMN-containing flavoprotein (pyridoxamine 5'-phosphate oxidase superfamily)